MAAEDACQGVIRLMLRCRGVLYTCVVSSIRTPRKDDWMAAATPIRSDYSGWKKLPAKAPDGTPYCYECRRYYGELHLTEPGPLARCAAYGKPVYAARLTYEEAQAGAPCPGCGIAYSDTLDMPNVGTMYFTDEERATALAEDRRYREAHPRCHAGRFSIGGRSHCNRCCPPPPMSPDQRRSVLGILHGGFRSRIDEARRVGRPAGTEPDPRERKLPGRATPVRQVRREYELAHADVKENVPRDEWPILWWYGYPDPEELYRWRIRLDCGCVEEVTTVGDDPVPPDKTWRHPWRDVALAPGRYYHRHKQERLLGPYRLITHWMSSEEYVQQPEPPEPPDWCADSPELWDQIRIKQIQAYAKWTVRLECGHLGKTLTEPGWQPGREPRTNAERAETLRGELDAGELFSDEPVEREHWLRMIELGLPSPAPEVGCPECEGVHPIVGYERVGWLVPPLAPPMPYQPKPRIPTREELLQQRIKELEAENTRLKREQSGG
jgi:hypothetical protein